MAIAFASHDDDFGSLSTPETAASPIAAPRACQEGRFAGADGTALFYRAWLPDRPPRGALLLLHRGHEHSGRWQEVVDRLNLPGFAIFAWDARGHGRSPGARGDAASFGQLVDDLEAFASHVTAAHGIARRDMALIANSVGAVIASAWLHAYGPPLRLAVLASPALRVRLYVPFAVPLLRLVQRFKPAATIRSTVKGRLLTHDRAQARAYDGDPLISPAISVRVLLGLHDVASELLADGGAIATPVLMLTAGSDLVVKRAAQKRFFEQLGAAQKELRVLDGFRHDIFSERERGLPIALAQDAIAQAFAQAPEPAAETARRQAVRTQGEFEAMQRPLPWHAPRRWGFALQRFALASLGRLSQGVRLGWRRGFDSGAMLDYVYENRARGWTPLGRAIDRRFLDSVGWRGIRQRKANMEATIDQALDLLAEEGRPRHVLDIAAGHGRYLLEALARRGDPAVSAELRDFDPRNLEAGQALAERLGLANVTFNQGDAFDGPSLARTAPRPGLAIVSGLYELFDDNRMIADSLSGLAAALEAGGLLIVTNQPWHPQLEMIARVLPSHRDGKPWVMRRRSQAEMNALLRAAGFEPIALKRDPAGIFTVTLARRQAA